MIEVIKTLLLKRDCENNNVGLITILKYIEPLWGSLIMGVSFFYKHIVPTELISEFR